MKKRLNQISAYYITGEKHCYFVTLERLHNSASGCPRFKAVLIVLEETKEGKIALSDGLSEYNAVFTFSGHYYSELTEARWIVSEYEKGL